MYRTNRNYRRNFEKRFFSFFTLGFFLMVGTGCSSLPDYANPTKWYKGAIDWVAGDKFPAANSANSNVQEEI